MELVKLEQLLTLATRYGVKKLKTSEVELELGPSAPEPSVTSTGLVQQITPSKVEISDEDMLFWSVEAPAKESN